MNSKQQHSELNEVAIGPVTVRRDSGVCIVAELGVNHLGDKERMKDMISAAHENGADLLKFQTYEAKSRYDEISNPKGKQFVEWLSEWQFSREIEAELWEYARDLGAYVFTSIFDEDSLDFAVSLGAEEFKVAAFEVTNLKLISAISRRAKTVIISRGMVTKGELDRCIDVIEDNGAKYVILHTISSYPLEREHSHLRMIHTLRNWYRCPIGHSDHTHGVTIPPLAVAAGATIIEKHFTVNPKLRESDNFFSITPNELKEIVFQVRLVEEFMGRGDVSQVPQESFMADFRRFSDIDKC